MDKQEFPIKIDPACALKWSWSTVILRNARTMSCHRVKVNELDIDTFYDFHNTPEKIKDRELMLQGQWPNDRGCQYCKNIEESGGVSDRMMMNNIPNLYTNDVVDDQTKTNVMPSILEVYFDNVCNMACTYCLDGLSSKIEHENNKYGKFESDGVVIENTGVKLDNSLEIKKEFWRWMNDNSSCLKRFHFLGGEPFFQKDFDDVIEFFMTHPNPDLEFNIVSNLSINPEKFKAYIDRIKKLKDNDCIKRFDLTASIDCWNEAQVYARHGLNLEWFEENMEYLLTHDEWLRINIHHTISALTVKDMPDLYVKINKWREQKNIYTYMCLISLISPHCEYQHPNIFKYETWKQSFEDVLVLMNQAKDKAENVWDFDNEINALKGIMSTLGNIDENNFELISKMDTYLTELDRRRNTNWKQTFPHLAKYVV